jgi:hypothetical protein
MDHLVYIHYGITPEYLYDTMEIAISYNKNLDVTLITNDKYCINRLNDLYVKYEYIDFFNTEGYNSFKEIFIYRCEWDIEEKKLYSYSLFNFYRFILLNNFCKKYSIDNVIYCDSDLAILHDLYDKNCYLDLIKTYDLILLWPHSTFFSCWRAQTLDNFVKYMLSIYNNPNDLDVAVENFHEINNDEKRFSDMWLLNSFVCSYPNNIYNINSLNYKSDINFIKLPNVQSTQTKIMFIGNYYIDWSKGITKINNKYSDTLRTLLYTYNSNKILNFDDETISKICFNSNENNKMINEIEQIRNAFQIQKQKIIHFQGGSKNIIRSFKDSLLNNTSIDNYSIDELENKYKLKFNCLIADCEGFMEIFLLENIDKIKHFNKILFEKDQPHICNYDNVDNILKQNGFKCIKDDFHSVYIKTDLQFEMNSDDFYNDKLKIIDNMIFIDEHNNIIDHVNIERNEQCDAIRYIKPDDVVLELGARYGTISCITNMLLNNKKNQVVVDPDNSVMKPLIKNKINSNSEFYIFEGIVSKKKFEIIHEGYGTRIIPRRKMNDLIDQVNYSLLDINNLYVEYNDKIIKNLNLINNFIMDDSVVLEIGASEGIYSLILNNLTKNYYGLEDNMIYLNKLNKNKSIFDLNLNIIHSDINIEDKFNQIDLLIINSEDYFYFINLNYDFLLKNSKIILVKSNVNYQNLNLINNNYVLITSNDYNVYIKDKHNIINFNNSSCSFGKISIEDYLGFDTNNFIPQKITKDIEYDNYNTILAHAECLIELNLKNNIELCAFINFDTRSIFKTLNNTINLIIDDNQVDYLNMDKFITNKFTLETGTHNVKLLYENNNAFCHIGLYWKYLD